MSKVFSRLSPTDILELVLGVVVSFILYRGWCAVRSLMLRLNVASFHKVLQRAVVLERVIRRLDDNVVLPDSRPVLPEWVIANRNALFIPEDMITRKMRSELSRSWVDLQMYIDLLFPIVANLDPFIKGMYRRSGESYRSRLQTQDQAMQRLIQLVEYYGLFTPGEDLIKLYQENV